jgi:hypothetical protein
MLDALCKARVVAFLASVATIYSVAIGVVVILPRSRHPDVVATGVMLDLTVVVPLLFAMLVRRRGSWAGVVPVVLLSLLGARLVLPEAQRAALPLLRGLVVPAELAAVGLIAWRVRGAPGGAGGGDVLERLEATFVAAWPNPRLARALAFELGVIYYGLFSWRSRPPAVLGRTFSYHRDGSYGAIIFALLMVSACEIVGTHAAVSRVSGTAAWILTAFGLYGVVWILGDYQAARLRPMTVGPDGLVVRLGLRWSIAIPPEAIAAIAPAPRPPRPRRAPGHLHAALLVPPQWEVVLRAPILAHGPYGITKRVATVALAADDREGLRRALLDCGLHSGPR